MPLKFSTRPGSPPTPSFPTAQLPLAILIALGVSSCGTGDPGPEVPQPGHNPTAAWAQEMARLDPRLGGGNWTAQMLGLAVERTGHTWMGTAEDRDSFMKSIEVELDAAAVAAATAAFADPDAREAGLALLRSPAGQAMAAADATILVTSPHSRGIDLWMGRLSDPEQVGDHAEGTLRQLRDSLATGDTGSVSPMLLAELVAATQITPEQATALGTSFATPAGRAWLNARDPLDGPGRFKAVLDRATAAGVMAPPAGDGDLLLPYSPAPGSPSGK